MAISRFLNISNTILVLVFVLLQSDFSSSRQISNPIGPQVISWPDLEEWEINNEVEPKSDNAHAQVDAISSEGPEDKTKNFAKSTSGKCTVKPSLVSEIAGYADITKKIINAVLHGTFKGKTYDDLSYFVDKFGSRLAGSSNLEYAIDYMLDKMRQDGLENVHGEESVVPHWIRGEETARMLLPRVKNIPILGLGFSVATPPGGIRAEVLVVRSFDELKKRAEEAKGKIIVFNEEYTSYGESVAYREDGASEAAKVGGLASLIRSVTPFSLATPHAGMQQYQPNVTQIPTACITVEDAALLQRMQDRGWKIMIELNMADINLPLTTSRNSVGEIVGHEHPNDVVLVSGHIDSWDVGQGAMDDGAGAMISEDALALLKFLGLRPRRTLRAVLWTSEEFGLWGVQNYVKNHSNEMWNFKAVFESDIGTFKPLGLDFSGTPEAGCIIQEVLKLFAPWNATTFRADPEVGSDIGYFIQQNVPGLSLNTENSKYFWYHHTEADTMIVENKDELDLCTAIWAAASYVLADLSVELPRKV